MLKHFAKAKCSRGELRRNPLSVSPGEFLVRSGFASQKIPLSLDKGVFYLSYNILLRKMFAQPVAKTTGLG